MVLKTALNNTLDFILPPTCPMTGERVSAPGMVHPSYWGQLNFIHGSLCSRCGIPFESADKATLTNLQCVSCLETPPYFLMGRAALRYDDHSAPLILSFKHGDHLHLVTSFVPWLERAGAQILPQSSMLIPVPLHYWRQVKRRYNQSALLAQALARQNTHLQYCPDILNRHKSTPPQGNLDSDARQKNVKDAFSIAPAKKAELQGQIVTLIDDVHTTGATLNECARTLLQNGAAAVYTLCLTRVAKQ